MNSLQDLFSDAVVAVETRDAQLDESRLWPEESAALGDVVAGRRWDWVMGRRCAREAIETLGVEARPVLSGVKREPLWPDDVVGAITHTSGYAAAVVALRSDVCSVGVDAEPDEPLPSGVLGRVSLDSEREWLLSEPDAGVANPDRLLFSAKEAIYKAWYPITGRWLGFDDAAIRFDPPRRTFEARVLVDGPVSVFGGRYGAVNGIVLASVEVDSSSC